MACADAPVAVTPNAPAIDRPTIQSLLGLAVIFRASFTTVTPPNRTNSARGSSGAPRVLDWSFCRGGLVTRAGQEIIGIERVVVRGKPLGAKRGTASAALVDRQLQGLEQGLNLASRRKRACAYAGHALRRFVQRSETAGEKVPVDLPFLDTTRNAEPQPGRKFVQARGDHRVAM